jgi:hypothetical protein
MPRRLRLLPALAAALTAALAAPPAPALQLPDEARYRLEIAGLRAGDLVLRARQGAADYAAAARLDSAGIVGLVRPTRFEAEVRGRIHAGGFRPTAYREDVQTPRRTTRTELAWVRGVPELRAGGPQGEDATAPWRLDPASQAGTVDPMTALVQILADVPPEAACRLDLALFDGRRRGRLELFDPVPDGDGLLCTGRYTRVAGYSDEDLAEARSFDIRLRYGPAPGGALRVVAAEARTSIGRARMHRH